MATSGSVVVIDYSQTPSIYTVSSPTIQYVADSPEIDYSIESQQIVYQVFSN